jgi:hypothetical protein
MSIIYLAFLAVLIHAYPSDFALDDSAENLFSLSDPDILDDGTLVSSAVSPDHETIGTSSEWGGFSSVESLDPGYESEEQASWNSFDFESPADTSVFTAEDSPMEYSNFAILDPSLLKEEPSQALLGDWDWNPDSINGVDSVVDTTNYGSRKDPFIFNLNSFPVNPECDGSSSFETENFLAEDDPTVETEGFLTGYYPAADSSLTNYAPSAFTADSENSMFVARSAEGSDGPKEKSRKEPYVPVRIYKLDPNTSPYATTAEAYTDDGTPIKIGKCPKGTSRACCQWDAIPPFSVCWTMETNKSACRYAKSRFCCEKVQRGGGAGINCQDATWVEAHDGRKARPNASPGTLPPSSHPFQELFPVLQPLPLLPDDPEPAYCKNSRRRF